MKGPRRNRISISLMIIGLALLFFALSWWVFGIKRIVSYPRDVDLQTSCKGEVQRLADKTGLLAFSPPEEQDIKLSCELTSLDDEYTTDTAVVDQVIRDQGAGLPGGLQLDDTSTFVFDRRDCSNIKSDLSTSSGTVVDRSGSWSINLPLGTKRESYNIFDDDAASAFAANFMEEDKIGEVDVFVFRGSFRHRPMLDYRVDARGLPHDVTFGEIKRELEESGVPLDQMISTAYGSLSPDERRTIASFPDSLVVDLEYTTGLDWEAVVEPVTGTIVDLRKYEMSIYVNTDIRTFLPLLEILATRSEDPVVSQYLSQMEQQKVLEPREIFRVSYSFTDQSVEKLTEYARDRIGPIKFAKDYLMILSLVLGAVLLFSGLALRRRNHPSNITDLPAEKSPDGHVEVEDAE